MTPVRCIEKIDIVGIRRACTRRSTITLIKSHKELDIALMISTKDQTPERINAHSTLLRSYSDGQELNLEHFDFHLAMSTTEPKFKRHLYLFWGKPIILFFTCDGALFHSATAPSPLIPASCLFSIRLCLEKFESLDEGLNAWKVLHWKLKFWRHAMNLWWKQNRLKKIAVKNLLVFERTSFRERFCKQVITFLLC